MDAVQIYRAYVTAILVVFVGLGLLFGLTLGLAIAMFSERATLFSVSSERGLHA